MTRRTVLSDECVGMLGVYPDNQIAAIAGCTSTTVGRIRQRMGIPVPKRDLSHTVTVDLSLCGHLLGMIPDNEIAKRFGYGRRAVLEMRRRLAIAACPRDFSKQARHSVTDWDQDFAKHPEENDRARAERLGCGIGTVQRQRALRSIPPRGRAHEGNGVRKWVTERTRLEVYQRDNGQCQVCGADVPLRDAHLHHVVHVAHWDEFGNGDDANVAENLLTLCYAHHEGGHGSVHSYFYEFARNGVTQDLFMKSIKAARHTATPTDRKENKWRKDVDAGHVAWLYDMGLSTRAIGRLVGISNMGVRTRLLQEGVQLRDRNARSVLPRHDIHRPDWLTDEMLALCSTSALEKKCGCSRGPIYRWRKEAGINGRVGGTRKQRQDADARLLN